MNPIETWFYNDKSLRKYLNDYFKNNIDSVTDNSIRKDIEEMFESGKPMNIIEVDNIIGIFKNFIV